MKRHPVFGAKRGQEGAALLIVIMAVALILAVALFVVIPGYRNHLKNARITTDAHSVATAKDVATIEYLQDGASGLALYYYDELSHTVMDREHLSEIKPYGRTYAKDNLHAETGAIGVPNKGDNGGPQILAIAVRGDQILNIRWTGRYWTFQDYQLMISAEKALLTRNDYMVMDRQSLMEAKRLAQKKYSDETSKSSGSDTRQTTGVTKIYWYDAYQEKVYPDGEQPDIPSYQMSGGEGVIRVAVNAKEAVADWVKIDRKKNTDAANDH